MYNRTSERFWSAFGPPFILLPASCLSDSASKTSHQGNNGQDENVRSEDQPMPSAAAAASFDFQSLSATPTFIPNLPYISHASNMTMEGLVTANVDKTEKRRQRKPKHSEVKKIQWAEDVPEYRGQMPIDELVKFINNGTSKKDSAKKKDLLKNLKIEQKRSNCRKSRNTFSETHNSCSESEIVEDQAKTEHSKVSDTNSLSVLQVVNTNTDLLTSNTSVEGSLTPVDCNSGKDFILVSKKKRGKPQIKKENVYKDNDAPLIASRTQPEFRLDPTAKESNYSGSDKTLQCISSQVTAETVNCIAPQILTNFNDLNGSESCKMRGQSLLPFHNEHPEVNINKPMKLEGKAVNQNSVKFPLSKRNEDSDRKNPHRPVVFANVKNTEFKKLDISFGFDVQDLDSGFELAREESTQLVDSQANGNVKCDSSDIGNAKKATFRNNISSTTHLTCAHTDGNNNCKSEATASNIKGMYSQRLRNISPSGTPLLYAKTSEDNEARMPDAKQSLGSTDQRKTSGPRDKESPDSCDVYNITNTKSKTGKISGNLNDIPSNSKKFSDQGTGDVTSSNCTICAVALSCTGRPVSIVAPNQPLRSISSSSQNSCSSAGQGKNSGHKSCSKTSHGSSPGQNSPLTTSYGSSSVLSSGAMLSPIVRGPILKVAPMLVENLVTTLSSKVLYDLSNNAINTSKFTKEDKESEDNCKRTSYSLQSAEELNENTVPKDVVEELLPILENCAFAEEPKSSEKQDSVTKEKQPHLCEAQNLYVSNQNSLLEVQDPSSAKVCYEQCSGKQFSFPLASQVHQERTHHHHHPTVNTFNLLCAQIFLYKTFQDSLSASRTMQEEVPATNHRMEEVVLP